MLALLVRLQQLGYIWKTTLLCKQKKPWSMTGKMVCSQEIGRHKSPGVHPITETLLQINLMSSNYILYNTRILYKTNSESR